MRNVNKLTARLRSRAGESIAEVLVSLLISSLALVMLAGMISAAARMVTRSREAFTGANGYVVMENKLASHTGTGEDMSMTLKTGENTRKFTDDDPDNLTVPCYSATIGGKTVIAYQKGTEHEE